MSSSAFCIDAAASTVMCLPCGNGGDVTTIAYSEPPAIAANRSEISSAGSSRSNCIRVPAGTTHNYIQRVPPESAHNYLQFETLIDAGRIARIRAERALARRLLRPLVGGR